MWCGWSWVFSKWYLFCAFQRAHMITIHNSSSCWFSLVVMVLNNSKKSDALFEQFWIHLLANNQTYLAKGHSQSTWQVVSTCWEQNSHLSSTLTLRCCKLSFVGKIFEQALHKRDQTLGAHLVSTPSIFCHFAVLVSVHLGDWFLRPRAIL